MKIKGRLILAFCTITMIPIVMIVVASVAILNYQVNSIKEVFDIEAESVLSVTNPVQLLNRLTRGVYNNIKLCAIQSPEKFEDTEYIESLNDELKGRYSFIIVRKNNEIVFAGNEQRTEEIKNSLPKFGIYSTTVDGGLYVGGEDPCLVKQQDFYYTDKSEGSVFVITDVQTILPQIRSSVIQCIIAFIIILVFTAGIFTYWIYKSILSPLKVLKSATNKMKEGNLNFSIQSDIDDEIGVLCRDFDDMRIHLKEEIEVRLQYEREMRELISNISHDLKTPITAIKGYAEGILDGVADTKEKQDKYIKTIYSKASDMTSLVEQLSLYSKIDTNDIPYHFEIVNLDNYFSDCMEEMSLDLEVKNIDIVYFNYTDKNINVIIDVEQLKRVLNNIIGNAVKYMQKKKGVINVRINESNDFVRVEIEDNGKGIAKQDLPNIFDRFYRADASRNSATGGSGLGLAISKKIIEDHSGKIWASSKEGVGTIIYFTLRKSIYEEVVIDE